jgi:hypothetical protein
MHKPEIQLKVTMTSRIWLRAGYRPISYGRAVLPDGNAPNANQEHASQAQAEHADIPERPVHSAV